MAMKAPTRRERRAAIADDIFREPEPRQLLGGLGEVIQRKVPLTQIEPNPNQPRQGVDEQGEAFQDLVGSIRAQGLLQPIFLLQFDEAEERFQIIAGERRWRAFRKLAEEDPSFASIPASVTVLRGDDVETRVLVKALVENIVREDLRPGERASALQRLRDMSGWNWSEMARHLGIERVRLMELAAIVKHDAVREAADSGTITQTQATIVGQGIADSELAGHLVEAIPGRTPQETRALVKEARQLPAELPAKERVRVAQERVARGVAVLGAPPMVETRDIPIHQNGELVGSVHEVQIVFLGTALARIRPQVRTMERKAVAEMLQLFCEQTGIWPQQPE